MQPQETVADGLNAVLPDPNASVLDSPDSDTMVLDLADLLPDASGEVVLFAEPDLPVNIVASESVTEAGVSDSHITATGVDVTGLQFYSFSSGITLYSGSNVHVVNEVPEFV